MDYTNYIIRGVSSANKKLFEKNKKPATTLEYSNISLIEVYRTEANNSNSRIFQLE